MIRTAAIAVALALGTLSAAHATGRAEVRYVAPEQFTDAGFGAFELERTQHVLTQHFERLARALPDGQVLKVEITDVDLAGEVDAFSPHRLRVMGLLPDAPRLALRYELQQGDQVLARGEDRLSDLSYLDRRAGLRPSEPLPYERRMLADWFGQRFTVAAATR